MNHRGSTFKPRLLAAGLVLALALGWMLPVSGCSKHSAHDDHPSTEHSDLEIVVTVPPLKSLVEALVPNAHIEVLIKPGQSPHSYELTPSDRSLLARADLVVAVGTGVEAGLPGAVLSQDNVMRMDRALHLDSADAQRADDEPTEGHEHHTNAHLWLDITKVKAFVPVLGEQLKTITVGNQNQQEENAIDKRVHQLLADLDTLDTAYRTQLQGLTNRANTRGIRVLVHHNAFDDMLKRYGIVIAGTIETSEHAEPSPAHIAALLTIAREQQVWAIITEPQHTGAIVARLADQLQVPMIVLDPLGNGDWFELMKRNLDALASGLHQSFQHESSSDATPGGTTGGDS